MIVCENKVILYFLQNGTSFSRDNNTRNSYSKNEVVIKNHCFCLIIFIDLYGKTGYNSIETL